MERLGLLNVGMTDKSLIAISPWPPPMPRTKNTGPHRSVVDGLIHSQLLLPNI